MDQAPRKSSFYVKSFRSLVILSVVMSSGGLAIGLTCGSLVPVVYYSKLWNKGDRRDIQFGNDSILHGAIVGSIVTGIVMNFISRRRLLGFLAVPYVIGWLMIIVIDIPVFVYVGRAICGLSFGGFTVITPIYLSEMVRAEERGTAVLTFDLLLRIGFFVGFVLFIGQGRLKFQLLSVILFLLSSAMLIPIFFIPESPLTWAMQNDIEKVEETLRMLRRDETEHDNEIEDLKNQTIGLQYRTLYFKSALKRPGTARALATILVLSVVGQASHISAYIYWVNGTQMMFFVDTNVNWTVVMIEILIQSVGFFTCLVSIDIVGRRMLLLMSGIAVLGFSFSLILRFLYYGSTWKENIGIFDVGLLAGLTIMHTIGLDSVPTVLTTEYFAPDLKWFAAIMLSVFGWGRRLLASDLVYYSNSQLVFRWHVGICCLAAIIEILVTIFLVVETNGRKLSDVHLQLLNSGRNQR